MTKLNHSRYIDIYAKDIGDRAYWQAKRTPTAKQIKFYKKLYAMCKENEIDANTGAYTKTRAEYAMAIDKLIMRLQEKGIDVKGNNKDATYVLEHAPDRRGRYHTTEHIVINDREEDKDCDKGNLYLPGRERVTIPKRDVEARDKLGGKVILSVDFETGETKWDKEWMDKMGTAKLDINKVDFIRAIKNNRTQADAIKELGISVGSFYKYKKMWAADITAAIDRPKAGMTINEDFEKAFEKVDKEPWPEEIHEPTMAETESFFGESTLNPEEPQTQKRGRRMNVLEAIEAMDKAREESYCVTCIFDQRISITPEVRRVLENHQNESEMIVDEIGQKLGELTIRL